MFAVSRFPSSYLFTGHHSACSFASMHSFPHGSQVYFFTGLCFILVIIDATMTPAAFADIPLQNKYRFLRAFVLYSLARYAMISLASVSYSNAIQNQPLCIVINKIDVAGLDAIPAELKSVFDKYQQEGIDLLPMSTLTEEGVITVKTQVRDGQNMNSAVDVLLQVYDLLSFFFNILFV